MKLRMRHSCLMLTATMTRPWTPGSAPLTTSSSRCCANTPCQAGATLAGRPQLASLSGRAAAAAAASTPLCPLCLCLVATLPAASSAMLRPRRAAQTSTARGARDRVRAGTKVAPAAAMQAGVAATRQVAQAAARRLSSSARLLQMRCSLTRRSSCTAHAQCGQLWRELCWQQHHY